MFIIFQLDIRLNASDWWRLTLFTWATNQIIPEIYVMRCRARHHNVLMIVSNVRLKMTSNLLAHNTNLINMKTINKKQFSTHASCRIREGTLPRPTKRNRSNTWRNEKGTIFRMKVFKRFVKTKEQPGYPCPNVFFELFGLKESLCPLLFNKFLFFTKW